MARRGWIYLREDSGRGYCFGKTEDPNRRDAEYSKENPFIKRLDAFEADDMDAAEQAIIELTSHLRLLENSKEWLRCEQEVLAIFDRVRKTYALMTYEQWEQIREREERDTRERQEVDAEGKDVTTCAPQCTSPRVPPCPLCGFTDKVSVWQGQAYSCSRCSKIFR
jgi:hypothetical protein